MIASRASKPVLIGVTPLLNREVFPTIDPTAGKSAVDIPAGVEYHDLDVEPAGRDQFPSAVGAGGHGVIVCPASSNILEIVSAKH